MVALCQKAEADDRLATTSTKAEKRGPRKPDSVCRSGLSSDPFKLCRDEGVRFGFDQKVRCCQCGDFQWPVPW